MRLLQLAVAFAIGYVLGARTASPTPSAAGGPSSAGAEPSSADAPTGSADTSASRAASSPGAGWPEHPDAHVEVPDDELVYSSGPR